MGYGDYLMALGDAWRLHQQDPQRRPVAIGDDRRADDPYPESRKGLDFVANQQLFNSDYRATPAPLQLDTAEQAIVEQSARQPYVVIEPHIRQKASMSKLWPFERYEQVARELSREIQVYRIGAVDSPSLLSLPRLPTQGFRDVLPYLKAARLYIGTEGGLHHAAAAIGTSAAVIFGGYTPPSTAGYSFHANLSGNVFACGTQSGICSHCIDAMERIEAAEVLQHARRLLALGRTTADTAMML